jgi:predicted nucleic acid-binding protein
VRKPARIAEAAVAYNSGRKEEPVLSTISSKNQITLPVHLLREIGLGPGDRLAVTREGNRLILRARPKNWARLLLDTNALIYFLAAEQPYFDLLLPLFQRVEAGQATIVISAISEAELLVRPMVKGNEEAIERIADLLSEDGIEVLEVDRAIARRSAMIRAAQLRSGRKSLKLPDAMIVATAFDARCDVIVGNDKDWKKLEGLPFLLLDDIIEK